MDGGGEIVEDVAALLAAGLDHRQHRFHEAAAAGALRAEGKLAPDHRVGCATTAGRDEGGAWIRLSRQLEPRCRQASRAETGIKNGDSSGNDSSHRDRCFDGSSSGQYGVVDDRDARTKPQRREFRSAHRES